MTMQVSLISHVNPSAEDGQDPSSLEDMFNKMYAESSLAQSANKQEVLSSIADPSNTGNPENLYYYQTRVSDYNLTLSMYAALTRKAVTAVDTLIRA